MTVLIHEAVHYMQMLRTYNFKNSNAKVHGSLRYDKRGTSEKYSAWNGDLSRCDEESNRCSWVKTS